jgi:hypothetical protein
MFATTHVFKIFSFNGECIETHACLLPAYRMPAGRQGRQVIRVSELIIPVGISSNMFISCEINQFISSMLVDISACY